MPFKHSVIQGYFTCWDFICNYTYSIFFNIIISNLSVCVKIVVMLQKKKNSTNLRKDMNI